MFPLNLRISEVDGRFVRMSQISIILHNLKILLNKCLKRINIYQCYTYCNKTNRLIMIGQLFHILNLCYSSITLIELLTIGSINVLVITQPNKTLLKTMVCFMNRSFGFPVSWDYIVILGRLHIRLCIKQWQTSW